MMDAGCIAMDGKLEDEKSGARREGKDFHGSSFVLEGTLILSGVCGCQVAYVIRTAKIESIDRMSLDGHDWSGREEASPSMMAAGGRKTHGHPLQSPASLVLF
jgi:hypothetical protein